MKYGLPYKGSKNKLAERIVRLLPRKKNLVDLFCGGCAVSHAALVMGKFEHIHINDLNWMCPTLFMDALAGKYNDDTRWISREDFFRLRDTDPYVAVVWSFGNNLRDYIYSREIEPLKRAIHYAIFFHDYEPSKELGHDLSFIEPIDDTGRRYIAVKRYFSQYGHFRQQSLEGGGRCKSSTLLARSGSAYWGGATRLGEIGTGGAAGSGCRNIIRWSGPSASAQSKKIQTTVRNAEQGVCRQRVTDCNTANGCTVCPPMSGGGQSDLPITSSVLDYAEVEIPADSVIYCDIPYEGTNVYTGAVHFDYERFYRWAESQTEPVFISSYDMPRDRFDCVAEWSHRSTLNDSLNLAVTERVFVPKGQKERGWQPPKTLSLFDGME